MCIIQPNIFTRTSVSSCEVHGNVGSILIRTDDNATGVTTLTLNKPEKFNVLTWEMLEALQNQLNTIADEEVRVLCLRVTETFLCIVIHSVLRTLFSFHTVCQSSHHWGIGQGF